MRKGLLEINPDPIRIVEHRSWPDHEHPSVPRRCQHEDGRGQCRTEATVSHWNAEERYVEAYCARHAPG